ncbi:hypothetical protein C8R43DRAFT_676213 [Mycena crocata]|nr:hypothetical protein C8R43DRAFT_676213 [Mycena crocata]
MPSSCSLSELPAEIIALITEFSGTADLLVLCRTNHRIHSISVRCLYKSLELTDAARVVRCCETLASNVHLAHAVRVLKILYYPIYPFPRFAGTIESAWTNMQNLEVIDCKVLPSTFKGFSIASFPRLRECALPLGIYTHSFLQRHTQIKLLFVLPSKEEAPDWPPSVPAIHMPRLKRFFGSESVAFALVPHSTATTLFISWDGDPPSNGYHERINTLALSRADILTLESAIWAWDASFLGAIANSMKQLTTLTFRNLSTPDPQGLQTFLAGIDALVRALPNLTSLSIAQDPQRPPGVLDAAELPGEFDLVRRWGEVAPALLCAVLPSETAWVRVIPGVWYPATKSPNIPDMLVRVKWFLTLVVSHSDVGPGYTKIAEVVARKDTVCLLKDAVAREGEVPEFELTPDATGMRISFTPR